MEKKLHARIYDLEVERAKLADKLQHLEKKVARMETEVSTAYVTPAVASALDLTRKTKITQIRGGPNAPAYRNLRLRYQVFQEAEADFKLCFEVPRYHMVKMDQKDTVVAFWQRWIPSDALTRAILNANGVPVPMGDEPHAN